MNLREILAYEAEKLAYELVLIGVLCDQLITRYCLRHPLMYEANPYTLWNMEHGLWIPIDVAIIAAMIVIPFILIRRWGFKGRHVLLLGPMTYGSLRLMTAVLNINNYLIAIMLMPI